MPAETARLPHALNLACLLTGGLLLLITPEATQALLAVSAEAPRFLPRMLGVLTLVFAGMLALGLRQDNRPLLLRLGLIQLLTGLALIASMLVDDAPEPFWLVAAADIALGGSMLFSRR